MIELKPCPFCGGEARQHAAFDRGASDMVGVYVECDGCGACSNTSWGEGAQERSAAAWNSRAERTCRLVLMDDEAVIAERAKSPDEFFPQDIPTARFCSACGAKYPAWAELPENLKYCNMCGAKAVNDDRQRMGI